MSNEELIKLLQDNMINYGVIDNAEYMQELYMNNYGIIRKIANKYASYAEIEDLMQEAYFGLREAVKHYEQNTDIKFITYAIHWIKQAMTRYIENNGSTVRMPSYVCSKLMKYRKFTSDYRGLYGMDPEDMEVCSFLKCGIKKLKTIKTIYIDFYEIQSLDKYINSDGNHNIMMRDIVASNEDLENSIVNNIMNNKLKNELWEIVSNNLTEQENSVIVERYKNNKKRNEIAKIIGTCESSARTIEEKALRKLRVPRIKRILNERFEIAISKAYKGSIVVDNILYSSTERAAFKDMCIKI